MPKSIYLTLIAICFSCMLLQQAQAEVITIAGSSTIQKFIKLAANVYSSRHPDIQFIIGSGGSTAGFAKVIDGRIQIGMMSRELTDDEKKKLGSIQHLVVGLDAVVPVVSREVFQAGIKLVDLPTLARIYQGKIVSWNQLGGANRKILVADKEVHRGTRFVFAMAVFGDPKARATKRAIILGDNQEVINLVSSSDQAIGYVSFAYASGDVKALSLKVDDKVISPTLSNIRNGSFPMARKLYLLVPKNVPGYVADFVRFVQSEEAMALVKKAGYIPVN